MNFPGERSLDVPEVVIGDGLEDLLCSTLGDRVLEGILDILKVVVLFSLLENKELILEYLLQLVHSLWVQCFHFLEHSDLQIIAVLRALDGVLLLSLEGVELVAESLLIIEVVRQLLITHLIDDLTT